MSFTDQNDQLRALLQDCAARSAKPVLLMVPEGQEPKLTSLLWKGKPVTVRHCSVDRLTLVSRSNPQPSFPDLLA